MFGTRGPRLVDNRPEPPRTGDNRGQPGGTGDNRHLKTPPLDPLKYVYIRVNTCKYVEIHVFGASGHQNQWISMLQASKSMDLHAPGIKIDGFACSRHQNRWICTLQASKSMDSHAPGIKIDRFDVQSPGPHWGSPGCL